MNAPAEALASLSLKDRKLFRQQCYIDGTWVDADSRKGTPVRTTCPSFNLCSVPGRVVQTAAALAAK